MICVLFLCVILQKLQEKTTSCQRPAHDRKRKFIKSNLALDTEGRQRAAGEVNFTAPKHLAKFNWFVATCAAKYRISITTQRPVMVLTSLCQRSETQIDLLLAAHVPTEPPPAYQPSLMKSVVSDTSPELCLCFFFFQTAFKPCSLLWFPPSPPPPPPPELFQDLSQLQETWLAEGECFKSRARKRRREMGKNG